MTLEAGDTVLVHFCASFEDRVIDSSYDRDPLRITIGTGQVVPGFEAALFELEPGQSATVTVPPAEAYGERNEAKVVEYPLNRFHETPQIGSKIMLQGPNKQQRVSAIVAGVDEDTALLDFNDPLAGKEIVFEIELVEKLPAEARHLEEFYNVHRPHPAAGNGNSGGGRS